MATPQIDFLRAYYPEYDDMSDEQLQASLDSKPLVNYQVSRAARDVSLGGDDSYMRVSRPQVAFEQYREFYSPENTEERRVPMGLYADKVGLTNDEFGEMLGIAKKSGFTPTRSTDDVIREQGGTPEYNETAARLGKFSRGLTLGAAENVAAYGAAGIDEAMGALGVGNENRGDLPFTQQADQYKRQLSQTMEDYQRDKPVESTLVELGGGLTGGFTNPTAGTKGLYSLLNIAKGGTAKKSLFGLGMAGATGGAYGYMTADGTPADRWEEAQDLILPSMLFGGAGQVVMKAGAAGFNGAYRGIAERMARTADRPTRESLKELTRAAYKHAGSLNIRIPAERYKRIGTESRRELRQLNIEGKLTNDNIPREWEPVLRMIRLVERGGRRGTNAEQFEKTRRILWKTWEGQKNNPDQQNAILGIIRRMDNEFENIPKMGNYVEGSEASLAYKAAREANRRYRNFMLLEDALDKAQRQAGSAGTGGNVMNKYMQAVNSIIDSNTKNKFFTNDEINKMKEFVKLSDNQEFLRIIGKLAPNSSGLMAAFNAGAAFIDPKMLIASGTAMAAKQGSENITRRRADDLMEFIADPAFKPIKEIQGNAPYAVGTGTADTVMDSRDQQDAAMQEFLQRQRSRR